MRGFFDRRAGGGVGIGGTPVRGALQHVLDARFGIRGLGFDRHR